MISIQLEFSRFLDKYLSFLQFSWVKQFQDQQEFRQLQSQRKDQYSQFGIQSKQYQLQFVQFGILFIDMSL